MTNLNFFKTDKRKWLQLFIFLFLGIPIMLLNLIFDCKLFFEHSY